MDLIKEDYAVTTGDGLFTDIPSKDANTIQYLRQFISKRLLFVDDKILADVEDVDYNIIYKIPKVLTFDGTSVYETSAVLYNEARSFTVLLDFDYDESATIPNNGREYIFSNIAETLHGCPGFAASIRNTDNTLNILGVIEQHYSYTASAGSYSNVCVNRTQIMFRYNDETKEGTVLGKLSNG